MILLFDGVCGLCNGLVKFVLKRDRTGRIRFAPLQGKAAAEILARHGKDPRDLDTVYLVLDPFTPQERLLVKGRAICTLLQRLGGVWTIPALGRFLPRALVDFFYDVVAKNRYRWFGKLEACPVPTKEQLARFLD